MTHLLRERVGKEKMKAIKKFWSNLKNVISVQKGALVMLFALLVVAAFAAFAPIVALIGINPWFAGVVGVIYSILVLHVFTHFYKELVRKSADIVIKKNNKAAYKARKDAEKASRKSQDKIAAAQAIENKYK